MINKSKEYYSKKEKYQNRFYNSLMNKYLKAHNLPLNTYDNKVSNIQEKINKSEDKNTQTVESIVEKIEKKEPKEQKISLKYKDYISPVNFLNMDKISPNISYESFNPKNLSFKTKYNMNILKYKKMSKVKRKLLNYHNDRYSPISSNESNNNRYFGANEPFLLNDKFINNSFMKKQDNKIKSYIYHNENKPKYNIQRNNDNSSKLLDKDVPSSLNNSQRFINENEENNNNRSQDSQDIITFRNKESITSGENKKTIEAEKTKKPKKFYKFNLRYKNNNNLKKNNTDDNTIDSYIKINTQKYPNSRRQYNKIKNLINLSNSNSSISNNLRVSDDLISFEKSQKIFPKPKKKHDIKNLLFNNTDINIVDKKNKDINNKSVYSTGKQSNYINNALINQVKNPLGIESCIISFRNFKKKFNERNKKYNYLSNFQKKNNEKINYIKKQIITGKHLTDKNTMDDKKILINDETYYNDKDHTSYKIYKKPNFSLSQNIPINPMQISDENNYFARSYYNLYKENNRNNNNENIFYNRQNLVQNYQNRNNNKNIHIKTQDSIIFRKKNISPLIKFGLNTYNTYNSHIYSKKSPSSINKNNKKNNYEHNTLSNASNTQSNINEGKNNKAYTKASNTENNSTYKLFNSQIINIRNNIFNSNDQLYKSEYINTTPFGEEMELEQIKSIKTKINYIIYPKIKNNCSFIKKYYNFYIDRPKNKNNKKLIFYNKTFTKIEKIMKKYVMPVSYISKCNLKIYHIPKRKNSYFSKIYLFNKTKEIKEKEIAININNKKYIKKKKYIYNKNQDKYPIKSNANNKLENDKKTVKEEEINNDSNNINDKDFIRIKVKRNNNKSNCLVKNDKQISNIKRIKLDQTEIKNPDNKINNNIKYRNLDLINIPHISQSIIEDEEQKDKRNSCSIKLKNNPKFRQRSSSLKFKNNHKNRNDSEYNIIKVKLPNSESRKKKYKINIIKRTKVKYKKNINFSEEKILINNYNKEIDEVNDNFLQRKKIIVKKEKEIEKDNKIISIIKEDLENYILFSLKNEDNKIKYNYSIIGQLLTKEKIDLSDLIQYYLKICFDIIDEKDKIKTTNEYVQNIIEKYKRTYLNKDNFIKIHEDILDILVDICIDVNIGKNRKKENKLKFDIVGALFYSLLINELFFISDLNIFINSEAYIYTNLAKIVRYIIIYSSDEKLKKKYFEEFKNCKIFFNNPVYFQYITKYVKSSN